MKMTTLVLTACLLASFGCDFAVGGLDSEVLTVSVTTVGANFDPDGYLLAITLDPDEPIGVNETKSFTVWASTLTVELRDIAANCTTSTNPLTVDVSRGPRTVGFFVQCN